MNPIRARKRAVFIGCSHGGHINPYVADQVLAFVHDYKPHQRVHLGDAWDTAAFRQGAGGSCDEGASVTDDLNAGTKFLQQFLPTFFFMGNHEDRLFQLAHHPNALIAAAAGTTLSAIKTFFSDIKCETAAYAGTASRESWRMFGDTLAGHGYMFGEMCTRDHVEMLGHPCIHAHDHKAKMQPGRMVGAPMGYSVGTLASIPAMAYAKARRATSAWSGAIIYGEYGDDWASWQLKMMHTSEAGTWRKPTNDCR